MAIASVPDNSQRYSLIAYAAQRYGSEPIYPWENQPSYAVLRHQVSGRWYAVFMYVSRKALGCPEGKQKATGTAGAATVRDIDISADGESLSDISCPTDGPSYACAGGAEGDWVDTVAVRCDPRVKAFLLEEKGILPAYHMNRKEWVTILLDGTADMERIQQLIDESFSLTAQSAADLKKSQSSTEVAAAAVQYSGNQSMDAAERWIPDKATVEGATAGERIPHKSITDAGAAGRAAGSAAAGSRTDGMMSAGIAYTDEQIPVDRARMERLRVPEKITEMQDLGRRLEREGKPTAYIFYAQAQLMADYTDDYHYRGQFRRYYPTYSVMNTDQLRGYFTFRTGLRRVLEDWSEDLSARSFPDSSGKAGQERTTESAESFVYLYIYELLCGTGVTPQQGYTFLRRLDYIYGRQFPSLHQALSEWIPEYIVYYDLERSLLSEYGNGEAEQNAALAVFCEALQDVPALTLQDEVHLPENFNRESFFRAVQILSGCDLSRSPLQKKHGEDLRSCVCLVLYGIAGILRKQGGDSLVERYFGRKDNWYVRLFRTAVFYDHLQYADYTYEASPVETWHCHMGSWSVERYSGGGHKSRAFGQLLREIDRQLRDAVHAGRRLKASGVDEGMTFLVQHYVQMYFREQEQAAHPKITIDMSLLAGIRRDAAATRDSLIVDEDAGPAEEEVSSLTAGAKSSADPSASPTEEPATHTAEDDSPEADEQFLVHALLYDEPYAARLQQHHRMLTMLVDSINDKAMEEIGDTIIEFDGDQPKIIEDYREDLEQRFPRQEGTSAE